MRGVRNRGRWLGWIGVVAVLSNVLAGALCPGPARAAGGIEDSLGLHLICTAEGVQVQVPGDGQNPDGQNPDGKSTHCTACTLSAGSALPVALAIAAIVFPATPAFHPLRFDLRTLADHLSLGGIRSRAPPLPA